MHNHNLFMTKKKRQANPDGGTTVKHQSSAQHQTGGGTEQRRILDQNQDQKIDLVIQLATCEYGLMVLTVSY